jgi:formate hydrogenlyase subunit 3/multisubunit Na+/H+ antiporter MnhD subunit
MILRSIFLNPLGPALVLALGGVALTLSYGLSFGPALRASTLDTPMRREQIGRFRAVLVLRSLFALLVTIAATALLFRLRLHPERGGLGWDWQPLTVAGGALEWRLDNWNWLVALLLLLLTATGLALVGADWATGPDRGRPGARLEWTLWLSAAALAFVFSANIITLVSAWVLLDSAIALRLRPGENPAAASRAWGLLSIAALVALLLVAALGEEGVRLSLSAGPFGRLDVALLMFAALVRAGVYPLHYWLTGPALPNASDRVALHLVGPVTGLWLLARIHQMGGVEMFRTPLWAAFGVFALLGAALTAWTADDEDTRWRWIAINRVSVVILAVYGASVAGPGAFVWQVLAVALGMALLALGQSARARPGWAPLAWFAALVLWGLPGTVGFLARAVLVFPTGNPLAGPFFALVIVAEVIFAAALWQAAVGRAETETAAAPVAPGRIMPVAYEMALLVGVFMTLAALAIGWGVYPQKLAALSPWPGSEAVTGLGEMLRATRRSIWAGLALSGVFGALLGIFRGRIFSGMRGWQRLIHNIASLDWLYQVVGGVAGLAMGGLRYFSVLGEGEGYVGWLLLAGFVLWVLLRG